VVQEQRAAKNTKPPSKRSSRVFFLEAQPLLGLLYQVTIYARMRLALYCHLGKMKKATPQKVVRVMVGHLRKIQAINFSPS
jgi:hypothetical protein